MLSVTTFRLTAPTIALFSEEGRQVARAIPQGSIIRVNIPTAAGKFIEVVWDGKTARMFGQDLRERGERVRGAA